MAIPRKAVGLAGVVLVAAALLLAGYLRINSGDAEAAATTPTEGVLPASANAAFPTDVAIPVEGAPVLREEMVLEVTASGQAAAWRQAVMTAEVEARVESIPVRENQRVGPGDPLVALDPAEYELNVAERRAGLRQAEAAYREIVLFDEETIEDAAVREERDRVARAKSGLDAAELQLMRAERELERTRVRAPFPGRVASVQVVPGQLVRQGDELMTVVDLDPIKVEVHVLEGELRWLEPGRKAEVHFSAFPGEPFVGEIRTINPVVDQETRAAKVTVLVRNPDGRVLPGMYARVSLEAQRVADRTLVPREAVLERDRRTMLFVHEDGRAKWRYVTTGLENDDYFEIVPDPGTSMVEPGEIVLVEGHYTLTHDARVRLVDHAVDEGGRPE